MSEHNRKSTLKEICRIDPQAQVIMYSDKRQQREIVVNFSNTNAKYYC
ncbi:MAG: hypothetical protein WBI44_09305 [Syntrophaceticus sp.]